MGIVQSMTEIRFFRKQQLISPKIKSINKKCKCGNRKNNKGEWKSYQIPYRKNEQRRNKNNNNK